MLEAIFGSFIFDFIGVLAKWLFHLVYYEFRGRETKTFAEFREHKKRESKRASFQESVEDGISNIALGMTIVVILLIIATTFIR